MSSTLEADHEFDALSDPARRRLAVRGLQVFAPPGGAAALPLQAGREPTALATPTPTPTPTPRAAEPAQPPIAFYDFPSSPFCIKLRAMLRHKQLAFTTHHALQPRHWLALQRHGTGKVPALTLDGRWIGDSTDIAYALDRRFPSRPLLPADRRAAALCHAVEEWADESLYFVGLHFVWLHAANRGQVPRVFGNGLFGRLLYAGYRRRIERQVHAQGTGRKNAAQIEVDLLRHLAHADALLADGPFLLGHEPWLCDHALFGQLSFLLRSRAARPLVQAHPRLLHHLQRLPAQEAS